MSTIKKLIYRTCIFKIYHPFKRLPFIIKFIFVTTRLCIHFLIFQHKNQVNFLIPFLLLRKHITLIS